MKKKKTKTCLFLSSKESRDISIVTAQERLLDSTRCINTHMYCTVLVDRVEIMYIGELLSIEHIVLVQ